MAGKVSKSRAPRPPLKLSKASQGKLLGAVAKLLPTEAGAGAIPLPSKRDVLPQINTQQSGIEHAKTIQQPSLPEPPYAPIPKPKAEEHEKASPTMLSQKRQIGSDLINNEHQLKRARLTRKNLALFNKTGKNKETNAAQLSSLPESTIESTTATTKTTSTISSGFAIEAFHNGILPYLDSKPPTNLEEIRKRYSEPRGTPSPPESVYDDYVVTVEEAYNEATMVFRLCGRLVKDHPGCKIALNQAFTGFPKNVGFNNGLSAPQPDFIEGLPMTQFGPFPIDQHIDGAVLYKDNVRSVTLPHFAGDWKGPDGNIRKATLQCSYTGAALVYARNKALAYLGKPDSPGHAEVTTFATDGTTLKLYAHYATASENGTLEYHQYQYASVAMTGSYEGHKDGRRGLRNHQDHALKQSCALRDQLKKHWEQHHCALQPITEEVLPPTLDVTFETTNADEDNVNCEIVKQPCEPTPTSPIPEHVSNKRRTLRSFPSSKPLPPANDYVPNGGCRKRKALLPLQGSSSGPSRRRSKRKGS
ncbi:hypothetical protein ONZ43_g114 [Nemania bipapillata]|uniref:Uncharacterized protein n=1 Tax=Nemania bipapillata TaxID=110536 RepID=A0ACC2J9I6_9PEZI|nr:hypothetical protein ONZ43_g114 [Nemania bipapillata]